MRVFFLPADPSADGGDVHGDEAGLTAEEAAVREKGGGGEENRSAREETDRRMDEQTARGRERERGSKPGKKRSL